MALLAVFLMQDVPLKLRLEEVVHDGKDDVGQLVAGGGQPGVVAVVRDQHSSRVKLLRRSPVVRSSPAAEDDGGLVVEVVADGIVVL